MWHVRRPQSGVGTGPSPYINILFKINYSSHLQRCSSSTIFSDEPHWIKKLHGFGNKLDPVKGVEKEWFIDGVSGELVSDEMLVSAQPNPKAKANAKSGPLPLVWFRKGSELIPDEWLMQSDRPETSKLRALYEKAKAGVEDAAQRAQDLADDVETTCDDCEGDIKSQKDRIASLEDDLNACPERKDELEKEIQTAKDKLSGAEAMFLKSQLQKFKRQSRAAADAGQQCLADLGVDERKLFGVDYQSAGLYLLTDRGGVYDYYYTHHNPKRDEVEHLPPRGLSLAQREKFCNADISFVSIKNGTSRDFISLYSEELT